MFCPSSLMHVQAKNIFDKRNLFKSQFLLVERKRLLSSSAHFLFAVTCQGLKVGEEDLYQELDFAQPERAEAPWE